ncbi:hypothetical protein HOLleu_36698 [Holothuria leucospilota]|uniref:Uncharacterized protein n=1 Tax=Holothuria leucospilota TaxID=206669 RepID=A0A9Q0YMB4_HOLLE|nr:hypothetical protein HOLleu_36698 [Holothuria leucospilota]
MGRVRCGARTRDMSLLSTKVAPHLVGALCLVVPHLQAPAATSVGTRPGFVSLLSTLETGAGLSEVPYVGLRTPYEEEGWNVPIQFHTALPLSIKYAGQLARTIFGPSHVRDSSVLAQNPRNQALVDLKVQV